MVPSLRALMLLAIGVIAGAAIQCGGSRAPSGDASASGGMCSGDADCVIACPRVGCCAQDCPCKDAVPKARLAQMDEEDQRRCGDTKVECPITPRDACDFDLRWRAACRDGACVAEAIPGGAAAEFRAPEVPARIDAIDPRCKSCWPMRDTSGAQDCGWPVDWRCDEEAHCRMGVPCDPACCDRRPGG